MKKIAGLLAFSLWVGCSGADKNKQVSACMDSALYGYVSICLPAMNGMTECRMHECVQPVIKPYLETGPVLGYYLNNETYKQVDKLKDITYEDYFMIYGVYPMENYDAGLADLEKAEKDLQNTLFEGDNFEQISTRVEEYYGTITAGKPVLLEKYSRRENVRTMIILMKYKNTDGETTVVSVVDYILVKKRLFNIAYYVAYNGGESIDEAKQKNEDFIDKLLAIN